MLNLDKLWIECISFDIDSINFSIDNCTNINICNKKESFKILEIIALLPDIIIARENTVP